MSQLSSGIFGPDFDKAVNSFHSKLKSQSNSLFSSKSYLSFVKGSWSVKTLNPLQRLIKFIFSCCCFQGIKRAKKELGVVFEKIEKDGVNSQISLEKTQGVFQKILGKSIKSKIDAQASSSADAEDASVQQPTSIENAGNGIGGLNFKIENVVNGASSSKIVAEVKSPSKLTLKILSKVEISATGADSIDINILYAIRSEKNKWVDNKRWKLISRTVSDTVTVKKLCLSLKEGKISLVERSQNRKSFTTVGSDVLVKDLIGKKNLLFLKRRQKDLKAKPNK